MTVDLGAIILGGILAIGCCLCGLKQVINNMDRPTFVDAQYWRNRQARQNGDMQNTHWIQPTAPSRAPTVRAHSYGVASFHNDRVQSVSRAYMAPPLITGARTFRSA
jgi:hypothetical protein